MVIDVKASTLVIELESGLIIKMPQRPDINKWRAVQVDWDFTKNKPVRVYPKITKIPDPPMEEPEPEEEEETPQQQQTAENMPLFSQTMTPPEEWGFWEE